MAEYRSYQRDKPYTRATVPRISDDVHGLRPSYDCVVIGSGYGGGVAASRMARAGESVCVLERGAERWPGEYPVGFKAVMKQLSIGGVRPNGRRLGKMLSSDNSAGMFHVMAGSGLSAFVCHGLGGTSLVNANVFLEADKATLSMEQWPPEISQNPDCLDEYYQKARAVLRPEPYPKDWPQLPKVKALRRQAEALGMEDHFYKVPQTTSFHGGCSSAGVPMSPSTLSGQDTTGLNDGSKTTTLATYIADAWSWGAEVFCHCKVTHIERAPEARGGYLVHFECRDLMKGRFRRNHNNSGSMWVYARKAVFLGAGALGTTEILLRSKALGLSMSDCIGRGLSGNGDLLAFAYNTDLVINAIGRAHGDPSHPTGPTVCAAIDGRGTNTNPLGDFIIQDGTVPEAIAGLLQPILDVVALLGTRTGRPHSSKRLQKLKAAWISRLFGPYARGGAVSKTQVLLVMSRDTGHGILRLDGGNLQLEFSGVGQSTRVENLRAKLSQATAALGGELLRNPLELLPGSQQITAHPLGGACMSWDNTGANGVTNHKGELLVGNNTSDVHSGLIVVDGPVVPSSLCVNPLATITALAERAVDMYASGNGLVINQRTNVVPHCVNLRSQSPSYEGEENGVCVDELSQDADAISFVEMMLGYIHVLRDQDDVRFLKYDVHQNMYNLGKRNCESARLIATVKISDDPSASRTCHTGSCGVFSGSLALSALKGSPFFLSGGRLRLFQRDKNVAGRIKMTYESELVGTNGRQIRLHGYKTVDASVALNPIKLWKSTTRLFVTLTESSSLSTCQPREIAAGILRVHFQDFISVTVSTLHSSKASSRARIAHLTGFGIDFSARVLPYLLSPFGKPEYSIHHLREPINPTPPTQTYSVQARDGVKTTMHMWEPLCSTSDAGARQPIPLVMIPGAAVDHAIFALPTVPLNAVNYFTMCGFRVFVPVHRIGKLDGERGSWTTHNARLDIAASLEQIRLICGVQKVYIVAHCLGSVALATGLLDGTIPAEWVLGITASQVFMNPVWSIRNRFKATIPLTKIYSLFNGHWMQCGESAGGKRRCSMMDQFLRFQPEDGHERCNSAACHRVTFVFGRCWNHNNLNDLTHRHIGSLFGGVSMSLIDLVRNMGSIGSVTTPLQSHESLVTDKNMDRLANIPIFFFVGSKNADLSPAATEKSFENLQHRLGSNAGHSSSRRPQYRRVVVDGYGHLDCWIGVNAYKDVFPLVREEIDRVIRCHS